MNLSVEELKSKVGEFRLDLYATEDIISRKVIIENQLEPSNHDHLGKIITYASGKDASTIVWIVKKLATNIFKQLNGLILISDSFY